MNLIEKVKEAIERDQLITDGEHIFAGVSGGADSVALLHVLHQLGYAVRAAHLNHSIRGEEADADEAFVTQLCADLGVDCVTAKADVPARAKEKGLSLEMAAREARHEFFRSQVESQTSKVIVALAHHADDQLETFFLRAARGTGSAGLGGMQSAQKMASMQLVRPLLGIRRSEILHWLQQEGLSWREDMSNEDETIPRNRVRHRILPILGELNERAAENILRTMEILRDEELAPEKAARRRVARDWLIDHGVAPSFDAIEQLVDFSARTDGTHFLDLEGLRVVNEYGVLRPVETVSPPSLSIRMEESHGILHGKWKASVSLERIAGRDVMVRTPRPGDRMNPYGMNGSKKLQDIFTDLKVPQAKRSTWPVVECGGEIIWLPGYRIAREWALSSEKERALHLFRED